MATFPEADTRLYKEMFVCRRCESKQRFPIAKILSGKASCRKCSYKNFRPVRKRAK